MNHLFLPSMNHIFLLSVLLLLPSTSSAKTDYWGDDDHHHHQQQQQRQLKLGDFAALNQILHGAVLRLPNTQFNSDGAKLNLFNVQCRNLAIGDVDLTSSSIPATSVVEVNLQLTNLDMACQANYDFSAWWLFGQGGSGTVDIGSGGNDATLKGQIASSTSTSSSPYPTEIDVQVCNPTVYINDINFSNGGLFGKILNIFKGLLSGFMESQARTVICDQLRDVMQDSEGFLQYAKEMLEEYKPDDGLVWDPLSVENTLAMGTTDTTNLLNFGENTTKFAGWLESGVNQVVNYLSSPVDDSTDMHANILLRQHILDDNGALEIESSDLSSNGFKSVIYEGHNRITKTRVRFDSVRMVGLDSLKSFNPLDRLGDYTHQNQISWDYLGLDIQATIELTPSTLSNSIIETSRDTRIEEQVDIFIGINDLDAELSIISLFDQHLLEMIPLGSLLELENILPCLQSTIMHADITSLSVDINDVLTPTMSGFVSPGMDRIFSSSMDAGFLLYENILLNAAPQFFQKTLRPIFAEHLLEKIIGDGASTTCPLPLDSFASSDLLMDFRDLLLPPPDAQLAGATGQEPYGNIFSSFAMPYLQENVFQGELFNAGYVRPFTKSQSNMEGVLVFSDTLFQYVDAIPSSIYDSLMFTVSDLRFHNIDTVADPMSVLYPVDWNTLSNTIAFDGTGDNKNLTLTVRIALEIEGNDSPLKMQNTFDLSLSVPSLALSFEIMANLRESSVMSFPVFDLTNYHCWIASLDNSLAKSLVLLGLSLDIDSFRIGSNCVACSTPGFGFISEILQNLETIGFNSLYKDGIVAMLVGFIDGAQSFAIENLVDAAPKHCPHHPSYDPAAEVTDFPWAGLPALRSDSAETATAIGIIAIQCAMIGAAKNQLLLAEEGKKYPSNETIQMEFPEGSRIVNWTSLDEDIGDWAGLAFEELRYHLKGTVKESPGADTRSGITRSDLQVNEMLRAGILDSDGVYTIHFNELGFALDFGLNFGLALKTVKIYGLDTIIDLEPLVPTSPQMLKNSVWFETLSVVFEVEVDSTPMTISYKLQDILAQVDISLALDLGILEAIQLGSVFDMSRIVPCAVSGIQDILFSSLDLTTTHIFDPVINGYLSDENQENVQSIYQNLLSTYRTDLIDAMPLVSDSLLKEILNAVLPGILESQRCLPPFNYSSTGIVDFRDLLLTESLSSSFGGSGISPYSNLFRTIYDIMQRNILQTGASNINDLVRKFTGQLSNGPGSVFLQGNSIEHSGPIKMAGLEATFGVVISDVAIENIDSVGDPLDIFRPVLGDAHILNNTVSFGVDSKPLRVTGKLLLSLFDEGDINLLNEMRFTISLENVVLIAPVLLRIAETDLASFPLRDLTNIHCWLSAILSKSEDRGTRLRGIGMVDQSFSVGNFFLDVNCTSCSSPQFDELLLSLYDFSNTSEAIESIHSKIDNLLDSDFIQVFLDNVVDDSAMKCPHRPEFDPYALEEGFLLSPAETLGLLQDESVDKPIYFTVINSIIAGIIFIFGILCRWIVNRRNRRWIESLSREGHLHLELQQQKEKEMIEMLNKTTTSLFKSECIPKRVRYGVPLVLAVNLGLFLGAHLGVLSVVNIEASVAGEEFTIDEFMKFTFFESTKNTYHNGGAEMVILLWIFGCIWLYVKTFLSLIMWMVPPERLGVTNRGIVLLWIDAAARLSVIDIATVIVVVALLLVFVGGPDESYVSDDTMYSLKAIVVPRAGFYCMLIAQRISRLSSRFLLDNHEQVIKNAANDFESNTKALDIGDIDNNNNSDSDNEQSRQSQHKSLDGESSRNFEAQCSNEEAIECAVSGSILNDEEHIIEIPEAPHKESRWGVIGVYFGAITIVIVFIIGAIFAPSISLDVSSVAAMAIESDKTYSYGVFLVICGVLLKARFVFGSTASYLGFGLLLFAGVASVGAVFIMKLHKYIKQKLKERQSTALMTPSFGHKGCGMPHFIRLRKWKHMEIFLISFSAGIWQLGSMLSYTIFFYCEILNRIFAIMAFIGLAEEPNAEQCYDIQASLPENLIIILGSFGVLLATFILQAYSQYKKNITESLQWIDNDDVPQLSLAWSQDRSKNTKYAYIASTRTASMSWDSFNDSTRKTRGTPFKDETISNSSDLGDSPDPTI